MNYNELELKRLLKNTKISRGLIKHYINEKSNHYNQVIEEQKKIIKNLDSNLVNKNQEIEELKDTIKQMQYNMDQEHEVEKTIREDYGFIFNEYCKFSKTIEILRKRICLHNKYYVTYDNLAGDPLTEEEYQILEDVLNNE